MNRRQFLQTSAAGALFLKFRQRAWAYAQSPHLKKFVQPLPALGPTGIPVASPDVTTYPGLDYYKIAMGEYSQQLHPDLPKATKLWGYADATNSAGIGGFTPSFRHLGPVIVAQSGRPVRINFVNQLPATHMLPVDVSLPGAEMAQNRAVPHLHGGHVPWVSDGGPFAWFTPDGSSGPSRVSWLPVGSGNSTLTADNYYPNDQSARLMWYHDHAMGNTRLNAYAGLASGYVLRDSAEAALIASGAIPWREIPLIIQDKTFKQEYDQWGAPGDLWYPSVYDPERWELAEGGAPPAPSCVPEFFGDTMLVNGVVTPYVEVEPRRYRLRILNACNARFCTLRLVYAQGDTFPDSTEPRANKDGPPFLQIGNEGGFLGGPSSNGVWMNTKPASTLLLAPAERADIIVDFSRVDPGSVLILYNDAPAPFPMGGPDYDFHMTHHTSLPPPGFSPNTRTLLQVRVKPLEGSSDPQAPALVLPTASPAFLVPPGVTDLPPGVPVRNLTLVEDFDANGRLIQRLGTDVRLHEDTFARDYMDEPTETPTAGSTEVWRIFNLTGDTHPIHFHLVNAQIISRQAFDARHFNGTPRFMGRPKPPAPNEMGWKETIQMSPGECTTVIMKFDLAPGPQGVTVPTSPRIGGHEFVWHCHILEHEEHDMMRPLRVD